MNDKDTVDIVTEGEVTVVSFNSVSISAVSGVEEVSVELRNFIEANQPKRMVVDFGRVVFFSSQMLGLLVDMWRRLKEYGGVILISGINPQLSRVFKITNLDKIFEFAPDRESAVKAISAMKL